MKKQGFMIKEVTMIQINFQSWESKRKGVICGTYFKFPECTEKNSFGAVVGAAQIMDARIFKGFFGRFFSLCLYVSHSQ